MTASDRDIYEELRGPLVRFAASLVGPNDAADLVSEVVVATLERRSLASLDNPKAYLMQAVLNRARSAHKRLGRERQALFRYALVAGADGPAVDHVLVPDLVSTVVGLPVQQRAAIYLVYWMDMTPTEGARLLGVKPATFRRYLYLARKKLRRHIDA